MDLLDALGLETLFIDKELVHIYAKSKHLKYQQRRP